MKIKPLTTLLLGLLAVPAAAASPLAPVALTEVSTADHGKLDWFEGTYEEALAEAAKSKKLIFMDFWTDW
jgi:hypothetical protein